MSDTTDAPNNLRAARDRIGYSREMVTRRPELHPPVSSKTLERWEKGAPIKWFRVEQLAGIYKCEPDDLMPEAVAA